MLNLDPSPSFAHANMKDAFRVCVGGRRDLATSDMNVRMVRVY